jgi:hypothetical protein
VINPNYRKQLTTKTSGGRITLRATWRLCQTLSLSQDLIRTRAYELYESRGREPGQDEQDWLRAEQEIRKA